MRRSAILLARQEATRLLVVAGPLIVAQIAQMGMSFVDTLMAGRLGGGALAGIALGSVVFQLTLTVCMGVLFAVAPLVAQARGAERPDDAARAARQGLWLAAMLFVPAWLLFWNAEPLLLAAGQDPGTVALAGGYLRAAAWGFLPALLLTALRGFLEGLADTRPVMLVLFLGIGLNVLANNAFMFGRWGFPELGLVGTGVATTVVHAAMAVAAGAVVLLRYAPYRVFRGLRRPDPDVLRELFRVGWPIGLTLGFEVSLFAVAAVLMGLFGQAALAGHQIAVQLASVTFMVPVGLSIATGVRVGAAAGRGDSAGVRRAGLTGVASSVAFMCCTALLFWTAPRPLVHLFLDVNDPANASAVRFATSFLAIAATFQVVDGIQVSAAGALRGLRDTRVPMIISLLAYWVVGMSAGVTLAFVVGLEGRGLWMGLVLGLGTAAVLMLRRFLALSASPRLEAGAGASALGRGLQ